jgi:hypothetical protein
VPALWKSTAGTAAIHPRRSQRIGSALPPQLSHRLVTLHPCGSRPSIEGVCCLTLLLLSKSFEQMLGVPPSNAQELHHNAVRHVLLNFQYVISRFYLITPMKQRKTCANSKF